MIVGRTLSIPGRLSRTEIAFPMGQRVAVIGPNGGGKTSLLRALAGVEGARGDVSLGDERLNAAGRTRRRQLVGLLPASRDLRWPIAVRDVIGLGLDRSDNARVAELLDMFELDSLADRHANELSTGERARVLMARVLASRPRLLLLDEPLANLDPRWVLRFLDVIDAAASHGTTVVVALHDLGRVDRFDRAVLVDGGRLVKDETPDLLIADPAFEKAFQVSAEAAGIRPPAGPRSSR